MPTSPLTRAAELASLRALVAAPDPRSLLHAATAPTTITVRVFAGEKEAFEAVRRALSVAAAARVTQPQALHQLLAFALEHWDLFVATAGLDPDRATDRSG